jgi:serralysin
MPAGLLNGSVFPMTGNKLIDAMTNGYRWQLDSSRTVDWSISNGWFGETWTNPTDFAVRTATVLSFFSSYANINFNYLGHYSSPLTANNAGSDINFSLDSNNIYFNNNNYWAVGHFPNPNEVQRGDIYINAKSSANTISYEPGAAGWFLLIHEIGHTLGLKHPHDDGGTGRPTFSQLGWGKLDIDYMTVMSYNDDFNYNLTTFDPATPMILDVLALQYLYGKNMSTNAGATTYTLTDIPLYSTIWDASGIDTVNVSTSSQGWYIELPNIQLSTLVDTKAGVAMPLFDYLLLNLDTSPTCLWWLAGDFENVIGSNFSDQIYGNSLANNINGGGGNDFIQGGLGADTIDGGTGIDTADYSDKKQSVVVTLNGAAPVSVKVNGIVEDSIKNIENIIGGSAADTLTGDANDNVLNGGAGADKLAGGAGNDTYYVDNIGDVVTEAVSAGNDIVYSSVNFTLLPNIEMLSMLGDSNINATGNLSNNLITGNSGNNIINGGAGSDILIGGSGNDTYIIDNIGDTTVELSGQGVDFVQSSVSVSGLVADDATTAYLNGLFENIQLTGTSSINATGNDYDNTITGNTGSNIIKGMGGNDIIYGGKGSDALTGGTGTDLFVFTAGDSGQTSLTLDKIMDYTKGSFGTGDLIVYSQNLTIGGSAATATSTQASINMTTGLATFATGSGTTLSDAILDIATRMTAATNTNGEFALFKVNNTGDYYAFISDGTAGVGANDVLIQLIGVSSYTSINLTGGGLTIVT